MGGRNTLGPRKPYPEICIPVDTTRADRKPTPDDISQHLVGLNRGRRTPPFRRRTKRDSTGVWSIFPSRTRSRRRSWRCTIMFNRLPSRKERTDPRCRVARVSMLKLGQTERIHRHRGYRIRLPYIWIAWTRHLRWKVQASWPVSIAATGIYWKTRGRNIEYFYNELIVSFVFPSSFSLKYDWQRSSCHAGVHSYRTQFKDMLYSV